MIKVFLVIWAMTGQGGEEVVQAFEIGNGGGAGIECMAAKKMLEIKNPDQNLRFECKVIKEH